MATLSAELRSTIYDWARQGRVYTSFATVTAPVIYSTAAGTGGPLLWNNTANAPQAVNAVLLALGVGIVTASGVASSLGITGGAGQSSAPTSTTAIDGVGCTLVGGGITRRCNVYRVGTVANAGAFFQPTHTLDTGAVTVGNVALSWVDLGGAIIVPPGSWAAVAASATATSAVVHIGMIHAEIPL